MLTPAPVTKIAPTLARGILLGRTSPEGEGPGLVRFGVLGTNYDLHLVPAGGVNAEVGKRLIGTIRCQARRIDLVHTGGRFVEPVMGRPRRVQGTVVAVEGGSVVVDAGIPIHAQPMDDRQHAEQFSLGQLVAFDAPPGATFTQA